MWDFSQKEARGPQEYAFALAESLHVNQCLIQQEENGKLSEYNAEINLISQNGFQ